MDCEATSILCSNCSTYFCEFFLYILYICFLYAQEMSMKITMTEKTIVDCFEQCMFQKNKLNNDDYNVDVSVNSYFYEHN